MVIPYFKHFLTKSLFLQSAQNVYETKFSTLIFLAALRVFEVVKTVSWFISNVDHFFFTLKVNI